MSPWKNETSIQARNGRLIVICAMIKPMRLCIRPALRNNANSGSKRMIGGSIWLASNPSRRPGPPVLKRAKA